METTESVGATLTKQMRIGLDKVNELSIQRRAWWYKQNQEGVPQATLAKEAGVVTHTVYTEIRKYKESKLCHEISQTI
tara:strand:- start:7369 stop:7602 length:234 start_codon:yes stop_codon:yes gene_type:complete